jgi:class 3 adenylate cyclase
MDLGGWLRSLGLGQYEAAFRENAIDDTVLPSLTAEDLKDLGVGLVGHRRKLLDAIASLRAEASAKAPPPDSLPATDKTAKDTAERRQVTVMFSDLVGWTALSARMDPEDLREVIAAYHKCVAEIVRRFDGFVAQYLGDGVLVYFGYPQAHEDEAERAVRSGLELVAAVGGLKTRVSLQTRVGIATGLVVVGDLMDSGNAPERGIVGETPNLAARLQGIAEPNMVVIAESTRRLLGNLFEFEDLGARDLKGIVGPVRACAALRTSSAESRFEALHATDLTALVGREEEAELLLRRWSRTKTGEGQVVLLSGEAGIGKSRLTAALLERLSGEPHARLRYFCSPQHTDSALYPIIRQMERAAGLVLGDNAQARLDKLDALFAQTSTPIDNAALLVEMLSLPNDGRYPTLELTPEQRRFRTLEALILQMQALTRQNPVLMIFEDVHWTDPTSLEVFGRMVDRIRSLRVLFIMTFRPEFTPPWIGRPHVTVLTINRLTDREIGAMVDHVVANKLLPANIRQDIIDRTDGIPLFVEEMTKAVLEAGSESVAEHTGAALPSPVLAVPASLHASLMARLDRLGSAKDVAQIGAAIGREFSHPLLAAVVGKSDAELELGLDRLIAAGLLFQQGVPPRATYLFKHALVQDAAYGTLLREPRRALHTRIAAAMYERFPEVIEQAPEILARHLTEAGQPFSAAKYWLEAGRHAAGRSANIEAVAHLTKGITGLRDLPETPARAELELALQLALGPALMAAEGFALKEAKSIYERASHLAEQLGDDRMRFVALWGMWMSQQVTGKGKEREALADELYRVAERLRDPGLYLQAHHSAWTNMMWRGRFLESRDHMRLGLSLYDRDEHRSHALTYGGHDPAVCALGQGALLYWLLGYPDQAVRSARDGIDLAATLSHMPSVGHALWFAAVTYYFCRDVSTVLDCSERLIALGHEHGLAQYQTIGNMAHGWALTQLGNVNEGLIELRQGVSRYGAMTRVMIALFSTMLAEAELRVGSVQEAITILEACECETVSRDEVFWRAGILNMKGDALVAQHNPEAEDCFRASLDIAREQKAKSLELRASAALARLYQKEGRHDEARDLLAPVYGWFTEGFDSLDLKEAKALLGELHA